MKNLRLFLAIDLSPVEKQALHCLSYALHSQFKDGRINAAEMYHITLHFFEEVPEDRVEDIKRVMKKAALELKPFSLVSGHPGLFGSEDSAVVWIGIHEGQEELQQLHIRLEKQLAKAGFLEENRPYQPHITLGREIDTRAFVPPMGEISLPSVNLSVHALTLLESKTVDGNPVYVPLATEPFGK